MSNSITNFINGFKGGTRLNRFRVSASGTKSALSTDFHIMSASIPGSKISPIPISYRGKTIYLPGERVYDPWQITILDEAGSNQNHALHEKFMDWHNSISHLGDNLNVDDFLGSVGGAANNVNWIVEQLDHDGVIGSSTNATNSMIKSFKLANCWPIEIGPLALDMTANNQLNSFAVTLVYTHISEYKYGGN